MDWTRYRLDNPDLASLSDLDLEKHHHVRGNIEGRKIYPLPPSIDWLRYTREHNDLQHLNAAEAEVHYLNCGRAEGRVLHPIRTTVIIPFGMTCLTAIWLCDQRKSQCSLPFDWAISNPANILDALRHEMRDFIRPQDINLEKPRDVRSQYGSLLPHVFDDNRPPIEQLSEVIETTNRRCERLLSLLRGDLPLIFLIYRQRSLGRLEESDVAALADYIKTTYPQLVFRIVALNDQDTSYRKVSTENYTIVYGDYPIEQRIGLRASRVLNELLAKAASSLNVALPRDCSRVLRN